MGQLETGQYSSPVLSVPISAFPLRSTQLSVRSFLNTALITAALPWKPFGGFHCSLTKGQGLHHPRVPEWSGHSGFVQPNTPCLLWHLLSATCFPLPGTLFSSLSRNVASSDLVSTSLIHLTGQGSLPSYRSSQFIISWCIWLISVFPRGVKFT